MKIQPPVAGKSGVRASPRPFFLAVTAVLVIGCTNLCLSDEVRPTCAALTFDARSGLSPDEAATLTDRFAAELNALGAYQIMSRDKMAEILKAQAFSRSANCSAVSCAVEAGRMLSIEYIIYGSVGRVGETYTVAVSLVNVESGATERSVSYDAGERVDELLKYGMAAVARKLGGSAPRSETGATGRSLGGADLTDLMGQLNAMEKRAQVWGHDLTDSERDEELARQRAKFRREYANYERIVRNRQADIAMKRIAWERITDAWDVKNAGAEPQSLVWEDTGVPRVTGAAQGRDLALDLGEGVSMEFVWIEPGVFAMGSPLDEDDRDADEVQHVVTLTDGFWMGKFEVTQEQWNRVMSDNPSRFRGAKRPVENISWNDCQLFIMALNQNVAIRDQMSGGAARLPTEAEWEYACRAGTTGAYAGNPVAMAWCGANSNSQSHPVGQMTANAMGLYDMHGNVWEWCQDVYGDYPRGEVTNPAGLSSGESRVLRGGGWDLGLQVARSANRFRLQSSRRSPVYGFRLALAY